MLRQIYILDTTAADSLLQKTYIDYELVNFQGLPFTFYKRNIPFEHQNNKFKRFQADQSSS